MIIGPGCLMNAFYLFLSYCSLGSSWWAGTGTLLTAQTELLAMISGHGMPWGSQKDAVGGCNDKVSVKERTLEIDQKRQLLHCFPGGTEAQGGAEPASTTWQGDRWQRWDFDLEVPTQKASLSFLPTGLQRRKQQWTVWVLVTNARDLILSLLPGNTHLFHARVWLPECDVFLTAASSQLHNAVIKSAIFTGPFPFLLLLLFPLF